MRSVRGLLSVGRPSTSGRAFARRGLANEPAEAASADQTAVEEPAARRKKLRREHKVLDQFFDVVGNWEKGEVIVGDAWSADLLRRKSSADLHKLWFLVLKERNMLLTMEQELGATGTDLPNPERKYRCEESLANIEAVVGERNAAVWELETGRSSARPTAYVTSELGLNETRPLDEQPVPHWQNHRQRKAYERPVKTEQERAFAAHVWENEAEIRRNKWDDRRRTDGDLRNEYSHHKHLPKDDDFYIQHF